jgi:anion-transporting  ArsA/GET3 family ATPase
MWEKGKRKERSPLEGDTRKKLNLDEMETSFDFCQRMTKMMDAYKEKVGTTLALMDMTETPNNNDIKVWMKELAKTQMSGMDEMACMVTEVVEEMDAMQDEVKSKDKEIRKLREQLEEQSTVVSTVVVTKDKLEVKASSKDMEERLKVATTQFKVMDIDIGKETENRAEILARGLTAIKDRVRSDMQEEWTRLAEGVDVAPLVRKTTKPTGKDYYSAPLLFTVQDKNKRWRMEEILRNSKIYPGFHWPQEMMTVLKDYKTVLKDNGVNEETTYVRIRPVERDGKVKIRADTKNKVGSGKFSTRATWDIPPICPEVRKKACDHLKPLWASARG